MYLKKIYPKQNFSFTLLIFAFFINYFSILAPSFGFYQFFTSGLIISAGIYFLVIYNANHFEKIHLSKRNRKILNFLFFFLLLNIFDHFRIGFGGIGGDFIFDIISFLIIMSSVIFINSSGKDIKKFYNYIIILSGIFLVLGLNYLDMREAISDFSLSYLHGAAPLGLLKSISFFSIPMVIFSFSIVRSKNLQYFSLFLLLIYITLGFYYGKRDFTIAVPVLFLFFFLPKIILFKTEANDSKENRLIILFFLILFVIYIFGKDKSVSNLYVKVSMRYKTTLDNIENFNRLRETKDFLYSANSIDLIIGKPVFNWYENKARHLHLGYPNFIMKGGIPFLIFIIVVLIKNIIIGLRLNNKRVKIFVLGMCFNVMIWLIHSPIWGWNPTTIFLGFALFAPDIGKRIDYEYSKG